MPSVTYRGFKIGGSGRDARIRRISGLFSRDMIANAPDLPRYHGSLIGASYERKKRVRVDFAIAPGDRLAALAAFNPLVDTEDTALFEVEGIEPLLLGCRAIKCEIPIDELSEEGYAKGVVEFEATDPALYANTLLTATLEPFTSAAGFSWPAMWPISWGAGGSGGGVTITNLGEWETWPSFRINGPSTGTLTNPIIEGVTVGERLALNANGGVSINAGEVLEISTHPKNRYVRFTSGASRYGKLSTDSVFFPLQKGSNELRYRASGTTTDSDVDVEARSAWI